AVALCRACPGACSRGVRFLGLVMLFFFSSRRRHTRFSRDWSSDVCSSDLAFNQGEPHGYTPKGGTGAATRTLVRLAESLAQRARSEERRVGKECRCRWSPDHEKTQQEHQEARRLRRRDRDNHRTRSPTRTT